MDNTPTKTDFEKHFKVLKDKLKRFLSKETPSDVLIIKAHLICEYYLNQILLLKELCNSKELTGMNFFNKLEKALDKSVVIEKASFDGVNKLNKLRNKIGHELEYSLSESDVDELGFVRGKEYILEKYDFEELSDLLHNNLSIIVIELSFILLKLVESQKKAAKPTV